ncbi:MAG TPA: class I SAM-dependent methyltransferase [Thermoplasmatales archaeon]|nr:class I SAM-dependent methyltransferase [Thermoplasmatales archaeon]
MRILDEKNEEIWDSIASSFDKTRGKPWKICIEFVEKLPKDSVIVDLGCGNGRHLIPCTQHCIKAVGLDISLNLLKIIQNKTIGMKNIELIHGNLKDLPFRDDSFDAILYIASLHNIKYRENRIKSLREVKRIMKKNGIGLISVWSRWQDRFQNFFIKNLFKTSRVEDFGDITIYWKQNGLNIPRFYHLYSKREFKRDILEAGLYIEEIKSVRLNSRYHSDNYFAYIRKI